MAKTNYNKNIQSKSAPRQQAVQAKKPIPFFSSSNPNLPAYLLFAFVIVLYANSLFNQYALDDRLMISENTFTKKGFSGIKDILTTDSFVGFFGQKKNLVAGGRYRPLSHITFAIEYGLYGFKPFLGHLINVLLYAFACLLVYKVLKMLFPPGNKKWYLTLPFIATALFIAHPMHTEVVANVKGRDDIMSLLGLFGAMYFVLKYLRDNRALNLLWTSLIIFLALMSKENAITFVVIIPLTIYFFTKTPAKKIALPVACLLAATVLFIFIRATVLGFLINNKIENELLNNPFLNATIMQKYATIFFTWGKYLILLLFPHPLTHDYYPKQVPIINMGDVRAIIPLIIYAAMLIYAIIKFTKKDIISFCILFFGLTFSIASNLVFPIGTFMNDRFMFIPLLGFCIVLAYLFTEKFRQWFNEKTAKQSAYIILGIILLGYSVKTISRNPAWHDDYTLFTTDVKTSTNSAKCNVSAGGQTLERAEKEPDQVKKKQMLADAIKWLNKGITIHPRYTAGWLLLGKAMIDLEDYKASRQYLETALQITPNQPEALNNWLYDAQISNKNKDYNEAIVSYRRLIPYEPNKQEIYFGLADVFESKLQVDSVLVLLNNILVKFPDNETALNRLGEIYGKYYNNLDKSIEYLTKAYTISPTDVALLENLGVAYGLKKDFQKSIEYFNKALALKPDDDQVYQNLAGSYNSIGDKQKAAQYLAKAAELRKNAVKQGN